MPNHYDLIGDVHGCGQTLGSLLRQLGYEYNGRAYGKENHRAVFIGDIFDRGPRVRLAAQIAQSMVENQRAVWLLGNHELNVMALTLGWTAPTHKSLKNASATLDAFPKAELERLCEWLTHQPLWLEQDGFRACHACWDAGAIDQLKAYYPDGIIGEDFAKVLRDSRLSRALWRIVTGPSLQLPGNRRIQSRDGHKRGRFRVAFWLQDAETLGDLAFQPDPLPLDIAQIPVEQELDRMPHYAVTEPPLFFGHYWRMGRPELIAPNLACLDYSAVLHGQLVAYQHQAGEPLDNEHFCSVDASDEWH